MTAIASATASNERAGGPTIPWDGVTTPPGRVMIVMAVLDEAKNIGPLLRPIIATGCQCLVVDDGSMDQTAEIALAAGAEVVRLSANLGQGQALLTGFKAALLHDSDIVIEMDGDGQHDPTEIAQFVKALDERKDEIVVGSRILGSNYDGAPYLRRTFLPYFTRLINRLTGYDLTDSMCGYRAFRTEALRNVYPLLDRMHEPQYLAAELFIRFSRSGLSVSEIPINLRDRTSGRSYKGLGRYGWGVMKAIVRSSLR